MSHGTLPDGCYGYAQVFIYGQLGGTSPDGLAGEVKPHTDSLSRPPISLWACERCGVVRVATCAVSVERDDVESEWRAVDGMAALR